MYNKLFTKILDSSIWLEPDPHRLVWITLIAAMDEHSHAAFACPENLAARARVPLSDTLAALEAFQKPDPRDPEQEFDGRRIERVPGGWLILNGQKYRSMVTRAIATEQSRERMRKWREAKKLRNVTQLSQPVTPSEAVAIAVSDKSTTARQDAPRPKKTRNVSRGSEPEGWFLDFKLAYPSRAGDQGWRKAMKAAHARILEGHSPDEFVAGARRYAEFISATQRWGTEYVKQAATFLGPDKPFLLDWTPPKNKGEIARDSNLDVTAKWLESKNAAQ